jgi:hypothetical protein
MNRLMIAFALAAATPRSKSRLCTFSSPPLAGEITEREAGREDFFNGLFSVDL